MGDYNEALDIFKHVEEKRIKVLGDEHPHVFITQNNIALTLQKMGHYIEALKVSKQFIEKMIKVLGEKHPHVSITLSNIASTLKKLGYSGSFIVLIDYND